MYYPLLSERVDLYFRSRGQETIGRGKKPVNVSFKGVWYRVRVYGEIEVHGSMCTPGTRA